MMDFNDFAISEEIKRAVVEQGFTEPTEIQQKTIPLILEGKDVLGYSQTGSGKTAAFGLPAIQMVDTSINANKTQILILCPTRELALQAVEELRKFSKYIERIHIVAIYGGDSITRQIANLRSGCQIVVGTPGRVMDHMRRRTLKFTDLKAVILDEADEMLNMGFREDIETILSATPEDRKTILFSATMPQEIIDIAKNFQKDPVMIKVKSKQMTAVNIEQSYFEVARGRKNDSLSLLLQYYQPSRSLVFCNTKKMVDELVTDLKERGYNAEGLHGDMKQSQRTQVMNRFKNGGFEILVATDVAARGIDVNDIEIVFNYDLPEDTEYYIHRIGRTARAGKNGKSFTLIQGTRQYAALKNIANVTKSVINKKELPKVAEIKEINTKAIYQDIKNYIDSNDLTATEKALTDFNENGIESNQLCLALLKMYLDERTVKKGTVDVPVENISASIRANGRRQDRNSGGDRRRKRVSNAKADKKFENVDMETVHISIGRKDRVAPRHILGAVAGESGLPGSMMGSIDIQNNYTTIQVPKQFRTRIVKALKNKKIMDKPIIAK